MNPINVLFLLEGRDTPSSRLRVLNLFPHLDRKRFAAEAAVIPNSVFSRPVLFRKAAAADIVVIQKKLFHFWELPFLRGKRCVIYDFDDMVMLPGRDKFKPEKPLQGPRYNRFKMTINKADAVIAGSDFLKSYAEGVQDRTTVIPTCVDTHAQGVKTAQEINEGLVLGWIGTRGNLHYLKALSPVFSNLARKHPGLTLKIVCDGFIDPPGVNVLKKQWKLEDESDDLLSFDVGLMPLRDDLWARGKCGFKLLQYMAAGLPSVASPVGVNKDIIQDGVNGFLAESTEEWEDRLDRLLGSAELRKRMGFAGRKVAEDRFDVRLAASALSSVLETGAPPERARG